MALTIQSPGTLAVSSQNGTSISVPYPAGASEGEKLLLIIGMKPSTANSGSVTTPAGWNLVGQITGQGGYGTTLGADTGNTNLFVYERTVPAGGLSGSLTVTVATNNVCWAQMERITAGSGLWDSVTMASGSDTTGGASVSVACGSDPGVTAGDAVFTAFCCPTDAITGFSAYGITQTGVTFGTRTQMAYADSGTGNDIGGFIASCLVSSGTATGNPTITATAAGTLTNVRGPGVFVRVREAALSEITGTISVQETGSDSFSASGTVAWMPRTGTISVQETGPDVLAASGKVTVKGSASVQEMGADALTASGDVIVKGAVSVQEAATKDILTASGDVIVKGAISVQESGADTLAANGSVAWTPRVGTISVQEASPDTLAASGKVSIRGSVAVLEGSKDSLAASGQVLVRGAVSVQESPVKDSLTAAGKVIVKGSMAVQESGADVLAASGKVLVKGSISVQEIGSDILTASGGSDFPDITGTVFVQEGNTDSLAASGKALIQGIVSFQEAGGDLCVSAGKVIVKGLASMQESGPDLCSCSGIVEWPTARGTIFVQEIGQDVCAMVGIVADRPPLSLDNIQGTIYCHRRGQSVSLAALDREILQGARDVNVARELAQQTLRASARDAVVRKPKNI